jgi:hypothetical protein
MAGGYAKWMKASSEFCKYLSQIAKLKFLLPSKRCTAIPVMGEGRRNFSLSTGSVTAITDFDFAFGVLWRVSQGSSEQTEGLRSPHVWEMCIWSAHIDVAVRFGSGADRGASSDDEDRAGTWN